MLLLDSTSLMAQTFIIVPAQFSCIKAALDAVRDDEETYKPETPIVIRVHGEGYTVGYDPERNPVQAYININPLIQRGYDITIQGDGTDKTVIQGFATPEDMLIIQYGEHDNKGMHFSDGGEARQSPRTIVFQERPDGLH